VSPSWHRSPVHRHTDLPPMQSAVATRQEPTVTAALHGLDVWVPPERRIS
jgi:hypothetical protein